MGGVLADRQQDAEAVRAFNVDAANVRAVVGRSEGDAGENFHDVKQETGVNKGEAVTEVVQGEFSFFLPPSAPRRAA